MARSARATARGKRARRRSLLGRRARLVLGLISFAVGFVTAVEIVRLDRTVTERFEGRLFNFLLRRTDTYADAEDLTQDTFVRAWQRIERYDPRWQFSTWLFTIARRTAATLHRRNRSRAGVRPPARESHDPARHVADRDQYRHVWDIASRLLSETQRTALWLRYAEDLPIKAIARVLGKTQVAVRVMLFRARQTLAAHERLEPGAAGQSQEARPHAMGDQIAGELIC